MSLKDYRPRDFDEYLFLGILLATLVFIIYVLFWSRYDLLIIFPN